MHHRRVPLGRVVITASAADVLRSSDVAQALARPAGGDWGELCEEDRLANERALTSDSRLLSAYSDARGRKFWIITEADRSATTVLLPGDY